MIDSTVLDFIYRRFQKDENWLSGNCYWFAVILHSRFPNLKIWLLPISNHFIVGKEDEEIFYDWNGVIYRSHLEETPLLWDKVKEYDELYYNRIIRDCIE